MPHLNFFHPLSEFYEQAGVSLPSLTRIDGREMPEPYRSLLVHERDMTPTLEAAYGKSIELRVLKSVARGNELSRQVTLAPEGGGVAVLFGASKIYLDHFPLQARWLVSGNGQPLGTILRTQGIGHVSRPEGYFHVTPDDLIREALQLTGASVLFGRRNVLWDSSGHILAEVVEILPPKG